MAAGPGSPGHGPMPELEAQGGSPAGASTVRPKLGECGFGGPAGKVACSSRSASGMSMRLSTARVLPSKT